jgi:hypothetical protein
MRPGVDLTTFDTMKDHLGLARDNAQLILVLCVDPEAENKKETGPEVQEIEDFYI